MYILETGFNHIAGGIKLSLDCLANGVGKPIRGGSFVASGHIDGTHVDLE